MGGILHALKIPFTGLFVGGNAVIFISLLAYFSNSRKVIIESTIKVVLVKFVVSPYSPINAYFAVFLQSLLGYLLFFNGFNKISPVILGFLSLFFSAIQKILTLTIIFGMTLWESIDVFFKFILSRLAPSISLIKDFDISHMIVLGYLLTHLIGGIFAGIYAANFPFRFEKYSPSSKGKSIRREDLFSDVDKKRKKKKWWKKNSNIALFIFSVLLIGFSFLFDEIEEKVALNIIFMLIRSVVIIIIWYYFVSPFILKIFKKYLTKKKKNRVEEIEEIIDLFPNIRGIIKYSWNESAENPKLKRVFIFLDLVFMNYLSFDNYIEK